MMGADKQWRGGTAMGARGKMLAAMAVFGSIGAFVRAIPLPSAEIALWRAAIATVAIGAVLLARRRPLPLAQIKGELPRLLLSGTAMGLNWILLFAAYRYTSVSVATLSYYFAPSLVVLASALLFRERLTARKGVCFLLATGGMALVIGTQGRSAGANDRLGIALGLGAAVLYAAVILLNKGIRSVSGVDRTLVQFAAAILVLAPYQLLSGGFHLGALDPAGWAALLAVGLVHTGAAYCLYFSALKELPGQTAALLSYLDPLVAVGVSALWLGEAIGPWQLVGGAVVLGCSLFSELGGGKDSEGEGKSEAP